MERLGTDLNEIDTTDCENSLESLQVKLGNIWNFSCKKIFIIFPVANCGQVVRERSQQTDLHGRASAHGFDLKWPEWRGGQQPRRERHQGGARGDRAQHDGRHPRLHRPQYDRSWFKTVQSTSTRTSEAVIFILGSLWTWGSQHRLGHGKIYIFWH